MPRHCQARLIERCGSSLPIMASLCMHPGQQTRQVPAVAGRRRGSRLVVVSVPLGPLCITTHCGIESPTANDEIPHSDATNTTQRRSICDRSSSVCPHPSARPPEMCHRSSVEQLDGQRSARTVHPQTEGEGGEAILAQTEPCLFASPHGDVGASRGTRRCTQAAMECLGWDARQASCSVDQHRRRDIHRTSSRQS